MKLTIIISLLFYLTSCKNSIEEKRVEYFYVRYKQTSIDTAKYDDVNHLKGVIFVDSVNFQTPKGEFEIKKYTNDPVIGIDSGHDIYWVKPFRVIYGRSHTWLTYSKLHSTNDSINNVLDMLIGYILINEKLYKRESN